MKKDFFITNLPTLHLGGRLFIILPGDWLPQEGVAGPDIGPVLMSRV